MVKKTGTNLGGGPDWLCLDQKIYPPTEKTTHDKSRYIADSDREM